MKKFPSLKPATEQALENVQFLDDPEIASWRHGPRVDYRVSTLVRDFFWREVTNFQTVCAVAARCCDQSFFNQVAHCLDLENQEHQPARPISDRTVVRAYESAQAAMPRPPSRPGKIVLSEPKPPSAAAVAKEIEAITGRPTSPAEARDACARQSVNLPLQTHGRVGRPKKGTG